ncbi:Alternative oxidase [Durusdinium trenchii]|uniref:Mitochondrial n=1 Tax=Durusdinium trenchii TaxID=1381693 RepID=A0ABP0PYF8_9DINO
MATMALRAAPALRRLTLRTVRPGAVPVWRHWRLATKCQDLSSTSGAHPWGFHSSRCFATEKDSEDLRISEPHFRESKKDPPLAKPHQANAELSVTLNHIWSEQEIQERLENLYQHRPKTLSDKIMHRIMWSLYRSFNWVTGFKPENTPVKAVEWRLIVLESFAGVPGFMAAMFRHFRCLRTLKRDHGWIHTLLEEAENERMHLLVCMKMFKAGFVTRCLVMAAQVFMTPFLAAVYVVNPGAVHRFVGYLEETACLTYANIIHQVETPGTPLHDAWSQLRAPGLAIAYWKLSEEAMWIDALKCMFADESNHRDVNHTFATMNTDDPNPFVSKHRADADMAWHYDHDGICADVGVGTERGDMGLPQDLASEGSKEVSVVSWEKSRAFWRYPLRYVQDVNSKPREGIKQVAWLTCNDNPLATAEAVTCDVAFLGDTRVPDSEGFCCGCDIEKVVGGQASRGSSTCDLFSMSDTAHCLNFDDLWYSVFEVAEPQIFYDITVRLKIPTTYVMGWRNVTYSETTMVLSHQQPTASAPGGQVSCGTLRAELVGDLATAVAPQRFESKTRAGRCPGAVEECDAPR